MNTQFDALALPSEVRQQILECVKSKRKIDAIKLLATAQPLLGLEGAKLIVDELSASIMPANPWKNLPSDRASDSVDRPEPLKPVLDRVPLGRIALQFLGVIVASHLIASLAAQGTLGIVTAVTLSVLFAYFCFMRWPPKECQSTQWTSLVFALYQIALPAVSYFYFRDVYLFVRGPEVSVPVVQALTPEELGKVVSITEPLEVMPEKGVTSLGEVKRDRRGKNISREYKVYPVAFAQAFVWTDEFRYYSGENAQIETQIFELIPMELAPPEVVEASELIQSMHGYASPPGVLRPLNERNALVRVIGLWAWVTLGIPALHLGLVARNRVKSN